MTQGKSKRVPKGKTRKRIVDPMAKKDWFDVKAPVPFTHTQVCKTLVNKSSGTKLAEEMLKGRVFEVSVGDLMQDEAFGFQLVRLRVEDVKGTNCLTSFAGMRFTNDKLRSLVRKWHTLIRSQVEATTSDGYKLRLFSIAITRRRALQLRKTTYCQTSQRKRIERKMREIMIEHVTGTSMRDLIKKLQENIIGIAIGKASAGIFPLANSYVYKVKVLKAPKIDIGKLMESHPEVQTEVGTEIQQ